MTVCLPRLQSSRIALSELVQPWGAPGSGSMSSGQVGWKELAVVSWLKLLGRGERCCPGGLKSIGFNKKANIMKLIAGSLLIVASAILFLARIQAEQPTNGEWFNWAIQLAIRCGLVLCVLGSAFIVWGMGEEALRILSSNKQGDARA